MEAPGEAAEAVAGALVRHGGVARENGSTVLLHGLAFLTHLAFGPEGCTLVNGVCPMVLGVSCGHWGNASVVLAGLAFSGECAASALPAFCTPSAPANVSNHARDSNHPLLSLYGSGRSFAVCEQFVYFTNHRMINYYEQSLPPIWQVVTQFSSSWRIFHTLARS